MIDEGSRGGHGAERQTCEKRMGKGYRRDVLKHSNHNSEFSIMRAFMLSSSRVRYDLWSDVVVLAKKDLKVRHKLSPRPDHNDVLDFTRRERERVGARLKVKRIRKI